jgi:hypothetical protein
MMIEGEGEMRVPAELGRSQIQNRRLLDSKAEFYGLGGIARPCGVLV